MLGAAGRVLSALEADIRAHSMEVALSLVEGRCERAEPPRVSPAAAAPRQPEQPAQQRAVWPDGVIAAVASAMETERAAGGRPLDAVVPAEPVAEET